MNSKFTVEKEPEIPHRFIQQASYLKEGAMSYSPIKKKPALVSMGGMIWSSPLPKNIELAEFYNKVATKIARANDIL